MWILLALLSAVSDAVRNVVTKQVASRAPVEFANLSIFLFSLPLYVLLLVVTPLVTLKPEYWFWLGAHLALEFTATIMLTKALQIGEVSLVAPLLGCSSLVVALTSPWLVSEFLAPLGLIGVVLVTIGVYLLNVKRRQGPWEPLLALAKRQDARLGLAVAVLWAIDGQVLKRGILASSPAFMMVCTAFALSVIFGIQAWHNCKTPGMRVLSGRLLPHYVILGVAGAGSLIFMLFAMQSPGGFVAYVIAIKRVSVLLNVVGAYWFFKEENIGNRLAGAMCIFLGILLIVHYGG